MSDDEPRGERPERPRRDQDPQGRADRGDRPRSGGAPRAGGRPDRPSRDGGPRAGGRPDRPSRDGAPRTGGGDRQYRDSASRTGGRPSGDSPSRGTGGDRSARDGAPRSFGRPDRGTRDGAPRSGGDRPYRDGPSRPGTGRTGAPRTGGDRDGAPRRSSGGDAPRRPFGDSARPNREGRPRDGAAGGATRRPVGGPERRGPDRAGAGAGGRSFDRAGRPGADRPRRDGPSGGRPYEDRRSGPSDDRLPRRPEEPLLPDEVKPNDLDKAARGELRTLSKENADAVARHLVMAARLIEDDPAEAHRHALAAGRRAGRVGVVRESVAITAYAVGDYALALRELRTYRRISGSDDQVALMVDSERGVGRPDRALELGRGVDRAALPPEAQVGLAMAMSGARLDLGDPAGALDELERAPYDLDRVLPWSASLYAAFAAVHEDLGDAEEAAVWQGRADTADEVLEEVDEEGTTIDVSTEYAVLEVDDEIDTDMPSDEVDEVSADEDAPAGEDAVPADALPDDDDDDEEPAEAPAVDEPTSADEPQADPEPAGAPSADEPVPAAADDAAPADEQRP